MRKRLTRTAPARVQRFEGVARDFEGYLKSYRMQLQRHYKKHIKDAKISGLTEIHPAVYDLDAHPVYPSHIDYFALKHKNIIIARVCPLPQMVGRMIHEPTSPLEKKVVKATQNFLKKRGYAILDPNIKAATYYDKNSIDLRRTG